MKTTILILIATVLIARAQDSGGKVLKSDGAQWIAITPEMEKVLNADPCQQLLERINEQAVKSPVWKTDYRDAHYRAFIEVAGQHAVELLKEKNLIK